MTQQQNQPKPTRSPAEPLSFADFEIDLEGCRLLRNGREIALEPRALDLLCYLAARPFALVRKDELLWHVWRARTLSDGVLSNTIGKVRKALGQDARDEGPIETVRGRGYRWRPAPREAPRAAAAPLPPSAAKETPFVGRRAALAQLTGALDSAASGCGKLVWVVGDAGAGKTRLLEQLASLARARGFSVWR